MTVLLRLESCEAFADSKCTHDMWECQNRSISLSQGFLFTCQTDVLVSRLHSLNEQWLDMRVEILL